MEKLQELADKDLKINDTELDLESLKTPQLHNKYLPIESARLLDWSPGTWE